MIKLTRQRLPNPNWLTSLEEDTSTDLVILCAGGRSVRTWQVLLAQVSPFLTSVFESMASTRVTTVGASGFTFENIKNPEVIMSLPDVAAERMKSFLRLVYSKQTSAGGEMKKMQDVIDLLEVKVTVKPQASKNCIACGQDFNNDEEYMQHYGTSCVGSSSDSTSKEEQSDGFKSTRTSPSSTKKSNAAKEFIKRPVNLTKKQLNCKCLKQTKTVKALTDHILTKHYANRFAFVNPKSNTCPHSDCMADLRSRLKLINHLYRAHNAVTEADIKKWVKKGGIRRNEGKALEKRSGEVKSKEGTHTRCSYCDQELPSEDLKRLHVVREHLGELNIWKDTFNQGVTKNNTAKFKCCHSDCERKSFSNELTVKCHVFKHHCNLLNLQDSSIASSRDSQEGNTATVRTIEAASKNENVAPKASSVQDAFANTNEIELDLPGSSGSIHVVNQNSDKDIPRRTEANVESNQKGTSFSFRAPLSLPLRSPLRVPANTSINRQLEEDVQELPLPHKRAKKVIVVTEPVGKSFKLEAGYDSEMEEGSVKTIRSLEGPRAEFSCGTCQKVYTSEQALKTHKRLHTNRFSVIRCPLCKAIFTLTKSLVLHLSKHKKDKNEEFRCGINGCNLITSMAKVQAFERHVLAVHTKENAFKCRYCGYRLNTDVAMQMHERNHTTAGKVFCLKCTRFSCSLGEDSLKHEARCGRSNLMGQFGLPLPPVSKPESSLKRDMGHIFLTPVTPNVTGGTPKKFIFKAKSSDIRLKQAPTSASSMPSQRNGVLFNQVTTPSSKAEGFAAHNSNAAGAEKNGFFSKENISRVEIIRSFGDAIVSSNPLTTSSTATIATKASQSNGQQRQSTNAVDAIPVHVKVISFGNNSGVQPTVENSIFRGLSQGINQGNRGLSATSITNVYARMAPGTVNKIMPVVSSQRNSSENEVLASPVGQVLKVSFDHMLLGPFICFHCQKKFRTNEERNVHLMTHK